ncbi:MAG: polyphosphate:AMP phosphotransferase [Clostridiaceae bacterium]|nr:polyphosphate:AMP phosphotransferase [Clostridiaceae bacterium]
MLEKVDLTKKMDKEQYKKVIEEMQLKLSSLERQIREFKIPVIIVFEGWGSSGKGTLINKLILPLDPRGFNVYTTNYLSEEEKLKPFLWRFWVKTPERGRIAIFDKSWYRRTLVERMDNDIEGEDLRSTFDDIKSFEKGLADDGNVIIKFFLHISKKEQNNRFKELESNNSTAWRVNKEDKKHNQQYDDYMKIIDEMIEETDAEFAPWTVVEATDSRFATIKVFTVVIKALEEKIEEFNSKKEKNKVKNSIITEASIMNSTTLEIVDLTKTIDKTEYKAKLKEYQQRIREIEHEIYIKRIPVLICYEGWDAAGKGGNIRRVTQNLDPRGYEVSPISAPTELENSHHYLWRFWNKIPKAGHITIFDRTWYGRVLVEKIEGFCSEDEWKRSYKEINDMEKQLTNFGMVVVKFWLQIDKDEQLRRFQERESTPSKSWKITQEDWRNRDKWDKYEEAANEMLFRTSTTYAPWTIVESNDKYYARLKALKTLIDAIEKKL